MARRRQESGHSRSRHYRRAPQRALAVAGALDTGGRATYGTYVTEELAVVAQVPMAAPPPVASRRSGRGRGCRRASPSAGSVATSGHAMAGGREGPAFASAGQQEAWWCGVDCGP